MNGTMIPTDDELGTRVARALDAQVAARTGSLAGDPIELRSVRRGARRRQVRRNVLAAAALVAVVTAGVTVLADRRADESVADVPPADVPVPPAIGAVAVLPPSYGDPVSVYATPGGQPAGLALPRIDVWQRGDQRVVVRTFDPDEPSPLDSVPVSLAPATTAAVAAGSVRGEPVFEQLAPDQWAVYLTELRHQGDNVVIRGVDETQARATFDAMAAVDGVLRPDDEYELVEHADAASATRPSGWYATVGYERTGADGDWSNDGFGDLWVSTWPADPGRASLELAAGWSVGSIEPVDGRAVFVDRTWEQTTDRRSFWWLDPSGVFVGVHSLTVPLDDSIVGEVALTDQRRLEALADELSVRLSARPEIASAVVDGLRLTIRGEPWNVAACIGSGDAEQCALDQNASVNMPPIVTAMDAMVDGQWVAFGAYGLDDAVQYRPDLDAEHVTLPSGAVVPVTWIEDGGYLWWIARVPLGTDLISTDSNTSFFGVVGTIPRPIVVGPLG